MRAGVWFIIIPLGELFIRSFVLFKLLSYPFNLASSSCPIYRKTSSKVVICTPYDKTPISSFIASNFSKNSWNFSTYSIGTYIVSSDWTSVLFFAFNPKCRWK